LNIPQPPEWRILFKDGTLHASWMGPWSDVAEMVLLDGLIVYETLDVVHHLEILFPPGAPLVLALPTPRPCFAYKRLRTLVGDDEGNEPEWLYTCFGYIDGANRITLTVSPTGFTSLSTPRSAPLTP
jgi:hypothetical protein